jgi:hypothetical protein
MMRYAGLHPTAMPNRHRSGTILRFGTVSEAIETNNR